LLEAQRGQDAAAVEALGKAEAARPGDPLPAYYLGQELVLVGQPERAAEAFERAIGRRPQRNDLLEIFQALGRVYQRTQKADQALQVWNRREALFPDDLRVQEQIASALAEEDQPAQALPRFQALATKVKDAFRRVQLAMQAAELKVRLGRTDEALHDFESLLGQLRPDSWLHREVRRKMEEVFTRNDDQAGLSPITSAGPGGRDIAFHGGKPVGNIAFHGGGLESLGNRRFLVLGWILLGDPPCQDRPIVGWWLLLPRYREEGAPSILKLTPRPLAV